MPKNIIVDAILSGASLLPGIGPAIKSGQTALADGKITIYEVEDFVDKSLTAIEAYTNDAIDACLEQFKKVLREGIVLEELIAKAETPATV